MDGMQYYWWWYEDENEYDPTAGSGFSFSINFPKISAIAELSIASFDPILVAPDNHSVYCIFTSCTWVEQNGTVHNEDPISSFYGPVALGRNGLTNLKGEIDCTAVEAKVLLNIFIWPSVSPDVTR